jgi:hypothetical protein
VPPIEILNTGRAYYTYIIAGHGDHLLSGLGAPPTKNLAPARDEVCKQIRGTTPIRRRRKPLPSHAR